MKDEALGMPRPPETMLDRALRQANSIIRICFLFMLLAYAALHWSDFSDWLSTITHGEAFGFKFDRAVAEQKVKALEERTISQLGKGFAQGAVARAARVGGAVAGARVLWLDTNLPNNVAERQVLQAMNISVQRALSATDAQRLARQAIVDGEPYDLIISNVGSEVGQGPLTKCPVVFSQVPAGVPWTKTLSEFTAAQNAEPRMGFALAEWLASNVDTAKEYVQPGQSKLIFYSASNGGISSTACARIVTNYADILLQSVVSALEEFRWKKLPSLPTPRATPLSVEVSQGGIERTGKLD